MSLSSALNVAQSALATISTESSVTSRNIAGTNTPGFTRKIANLATTLSGGVEVTSITDAANQALFDATLTANSNSSAQTAISTGLDQLNQTVDDSNAPTSPAAMIGNLESALQQYAASPDEQSLAQAVVTSAQALTSSLNNATTTTQQVREQADAGMATSVSTINSLLSQFQSVNAQVVAGTASSADITGAQDSRNSILSQLSQQIGISTITRPNGDMAIYTDSGVTLFDGSPRTVTFAATPTMTAQTQGNAVYVDGVQVTGSGSVMPIKSGALVGLADLRDNLAPTYQSQLDEIARGLVDEFSESDQSATPTLPTVPGLFTYSGAPAMPGSSLVAGLAGEISVNANVDPSQGGNLDLLRDGGISNPTNPAYDYNTTGDAGFSDRLNQLVTDLGSTQSFEPAADVGTSGTLESYAAGSVSWLEGNRQTADSQSTYQQTLVTQASQALNSSTGVNIDSEMSKMLDYENAYQASAKLISTVNAMYDALFAAFTPAG